MHLINNLYTNKVSCLVQFMINIIWNAKQPFYVWSKKNCVRKSDLIKTKRHLIFIFNLGLIWASYNILVKAKVECYKIIPIRVRLKVQQLLPSKEGVTFIYGCESELWLSDLCGLFYEARIRSILIRATCHYHPAIQSDSHFQATN